MHSSTFSSSSKSTARLAMLATLLFTSRYARAIITPTAPWSTVVDVDGQPCDMQWDLDPTGTWTNMTIQFMTGSNQAFVHITDVATGVDGTTGDGTYSWTCPDVTIPAPIYFYQFINNGDATNPTYTTRFTIADADGTTVAAPNPTQPNGTAIGWGVGGIEGQSNPDGGSSSTTNGSSSGSNSTTTDSSSGTDDTILSTSSSPSTSSSSDSGAETTVVTITPTTSSRRTTTTRSPSSTTDSTTGISSNSTTGGTGAADRNYTSGSVAGIGLGLAMLVGYLMV